MIESLETQSERSTNTDDGTDNIHPDPRNVMHNRCLLRAFDSYIVRTHLAFLAVFIGIMVFPLGKSKWYSRIA